MTQSLSPQSSVLSTPTQAQLQLLQAAASWIFWQLNPFIVQQPAADGTRTIQLDFEATRQAAGTLDAVFTVQRDDGTPPQESALTDIPADPLAQRRALEAQFSAFLDSLYGKEPPAVAADINQDGKVDVIDLGILASSFGSATLTLAPGSTLFFNPPPAAP